MPARRQAKVTPLIVAQGSGLPLEKTDDRLDRDRLIEDRGVAAPIDFERLEILGMAAMHLGWGSGFLYQVTLSAAAR